MEEQNVNKQEKKRKLGGRPKMMTEERLALLKTLAEAHLGATLKELTSLFNKTAGIEVTYSCIRDGLKALGFRKQRRSPPTPQTDAQAPPRDLRSARSRAQTRKPSANKRRYGYTDLHRIQAGSQKYPSSLTDKEWSLVSDLFEKRSDRPPIYPRRLVLDACSYVVRSGCSWRMLPKDFPPWQDVYAHWRRWSKAGLIEQMNERLRQMWRIKAGRDEQPTAALADSQSVKTTAQGGDSGFDNGKKVKGRKRHLVTDVLGLLLAVVVLPADIQDRDGLGPALEQAKRRFPSITKLYVDGGYTGSETSNFCQALGVDCEVVQHPSKYAWQADSSLQPPSQSLQDQSRPVQNVPTVQTLPPQPEKSGFKVLPKRWVIERTNAWNLRFRRLIVDHDRRPEVTEHWIWFAESLILLRRIAHMDHFSATIA